MKKPLLFVSHIKDEGAMAIALKELLRSSFLNMFDTFVSSDGESIDLGDRWFDSVVDALRSCSVAFMICSPISITRPWINFEAGAAWIRGVPVIPICHSGLTRSKLTVPLSMRQAIDATDESGLRSMLKLLASHIGADAPAPDLTTFLRSVHTFEAEYTFWRRAKSAFSKISQIPRLIDELKTRSAPDGVRFQASKEWIESAADDMLWLEEHDVLRMITDRKYSLIVTHGMCVALVTLHALPRWDYVKSAAEFTF